MRFFVPKEAEGDGVYVQHAINGMDIVEQMMRQLEAMLEEQAGWDQQPHFYCLIAQDHAPDCVDRDHAHDSQPIGALGLVEIMMPEFCYHDPGSGLSKFVDFMRDMANSGPAAQQLKEEMDVEIGALGVAKILNRLIPTNFYGFGMVNEGWTLPNSVPADERMQLARERRIHEREDRVELRSVTMATVDGRMLTLTRIRGEFPEFHESDPQEFSLSGRVPDAIRLITSIFGQFDEFRLAQVAKHYPGFN